MDAIQFMLRAAIGIYCYEYELLCMFQYRTRLCIKSLTCYFEIRWACLSVNLKNDCMCFFFTTHQGVFACMIVTQFISVFTQYYTHITHLSF